MASTKNFHPVAHWVFCLFQTTVCDLPRWLCGRCALTAMLKATPVFSSTVFDASFSAGRIYRSLNAPSRSLVDAKSHIGAVVVPLRQVCWNASVSNLKLSLAKAARVSQCETTLPFKTITSRKRQVHIPSPCHGHEGNTGDTTGGLVTNNASAASRCLLHTAAREKDQVERFAEKNTKTPLITINLEQPSSPSAVRNRWGQYWAASFLSLAAFASV